MSLTRTTLLTAVAAIAVLTITGGAFAKTFEAVYTVNIHTHASKGSSVVDKLYEGERVTVKACDDNDWCLINHDGPDGWVPVASLERISGGSAGPTVVIQGGFDFSPKPKKPGIIVDPVHPPKHVYPVIVGTFPLSANPGFPAGGGPRPAPKHPTNTCIPGHVCQISN